MLLVGLDSASGSYVVKDPARPEEALSVPAARLERARTAHGTDEDLLLVPLDQEPPGAPAKGTALKIQLIMDEAGRE